MLTCQVLKSNLGTSLTQQKLTVGRGTGLGSKALLNHVWLTGISV